MALTLPGSPYVESSDLVANYPAVSESLAERVDLVGVLPFEDSAARTTALPTPTDGQYSYLQDTNSTEYYNGTAWVAAGVDPGITHINTTTFTTVSSVSLNDVFTSTYENYLLTMNIKGSTTDTTYLRVRASGTDNTASNYNYGRIFVGITATQALSHTSNATFTSTPMSSTNTINSFVNVQIAKPQLVDLTVILSQSAGVNMDFLTTKLTVTTAYDGVTIFPGSGTITGNIRVYGYKNS